MAEIDDHCSDDLRDALRVAAKNPVWPATTDSSNVS